MCSVFILYLGRPSALELEVNTTQGLSKSVFRGAESQTAREMLPQSG